MPRKRKKYHALPPEPIRYCDGKPCYDKRGAETVLNRRFKRHARNRPDFLRIYHCPECNLWHLTHKRRDKFQPISKPRKA